MDREGRNWDKEEIPGSGQGMHDYILTCYRRKHLSTLGSQQIGPQFLRPQHPTGGLAR